MNTTLQASTFAALDPTAHDFLVRVVAAARSYLGAEVSFLAEFEGGDKVIRETDGPAEAIGLGVGTRFARSDTYCDRVSRGELPEVIPDAGADARVCDLPITRQLGIRSYVGVPVRAAPGVALGTLCCVNFDPSLIEQDRELALLRFLAGLIGSHVDHLRAADHARHQRIAVLQALLDAGGPRMVFQPIVALDGGRIVGAEALARFDVEPLRPPDAWFREAWEVGLGPQLELAAVRNALAQADDLPPDAYVSVNLSPASLLDPAVLDLLDRAPSGRMVVEVTEHVAVTDYVALSSAFDRMRRAGIRLAIDDLGAGYASLRHVLEIGPDAAKLDMSLIRGIDGDAAKRALTHAVVEFAAETRLALVAEGIETDAEARALRALGVAYGQGFFFCRPRALPFDA